MASATGHYARIEHRDDGPHLMRSVTEDKDQTYFLSAVRREQLEKVFFPWVATTSPPSGQWPATSAWTCTARRTRPASASLVNAPSERFWPGTSRTHRATLSMRAARSSASTRAWHHFTLGQRKGLHIGGRRGAAEAPWYVVAKDAPRRRLMASQDPNHPLIMHRRLATAPFHWINRPARLDRPLLARIRHRQGLQTCHIESVADDGSLIVDFRQRPARRCARSVPGAYDGMACLGSGELRSPPPPA